MSERIIITDNVTELGSLIVDFGARGPFHIVVTRAGTAQAFVVERHGMRTFGGVVDPLAYVSQGEVIELEIEWEGLTGHRLDEVTPPPDTLGESGEGSVEGVRKAG